MPPQPPAWTIGATRVVVGIVQGLCLVQLRRINAAGNGLFDHAIYLVPLVRLADLLPLILIASLGTLNLRQTLRWLLTAAFCIVTLSLHDVWRMHAPGLPPELIPRNGLRAATLLDLALPVGLFIGHVLLQANATTTRADSSPGTYYRSCWDTGWRLLLQSALSSVFALMLYGLLHLAATLFKLVDLTTLETLLVQDHFVTPVLSGALAFAFHASARRPEMLTPTRNVLLTLLARMLPPATVLVGIFLLALPWTGLQGLWNTEHATPILLGNAAALVVLINAAWQVGQAQTELHATMRWSVRFASLWLIALVLLAAQAVDLRISDHGWTSARVAAAAAIAIAGCCAIGYGWAATRRAAHWLDALGSANIATAYVTLALLLALFSPLADPARIAVNSQLERLASGQVTAARFDYYYLGSHGLRYGRDALQQLSVSGMGPEPDLVRQTAAQALAVVNEPATHAAQSERASALPLRDQLHAKPEHTHLPPSFLVQNWSDSPDRNDLPSCLLDPGHHCDAYQRPVDRSHGAQQILLIDQLQDSWAALFTLGHDGHWQLLGSIPQFASRCASQQQLLAGNWQVEASRANDLVIGSHRFVIQPAGTDFVCPPEVPGARPPK